MLDEHAELLVVAHQGAADAASVLDAGSAQFARRVGEVADTLRVALDVALFGGLSDAEHGLPPPSKRLQGTGVRRCCIVWLHSYSINTKGCKLPPHHSNTPLVLYHRESIVAFSADYFYKYLQSDFLFVIFG